MKYLHFYVGFYFSKILLLFLNTDYYLIYLVYIKKEFDFLYCHFAKIGMDNKVIDLVYLRNIDNIDPITGMEDESIGLEHLKRIMVMSVGFNILNILIITHILKEEHLFEVMHLE